MSRPIVRREATPRGLAAAAPDARAARLAKEAGPILEAVAAETGDVRLRVTDAAGRERTVDIPASALRVLSNALAEMARGKAVTVVGLDDEITTQHAADILNVSRPFLVGLLENGTIPFRKVGVQRRIVLRDLMDYKTRSDADRRAALNALARQAQELRLGYDV